MKRLPLAFAAVLLAAAPAFAQKANYDESKVPKYTLPDPLVCLDGTKVTDKATWVKKRRPEILRLFEEQVYGRSPKPTEMTRNVRGAMSVALKGSAIRQQFTLEYFLQDDRALKTPVLKMHILVYLPADAKGAIPTFLALNFQGNHTVHSDPGIQISKSLVRGKKPTSKSRGAASSRWAVETILKRGYGLATIYYGEIIPDRKDGLSSGPHRFFLKKGQSSPAADEWGAIAGWAWALSKTLDFFDSQARTRDNKDSPTYVDPQRVIVMGHSRLGKTALWAGAADPRFAMVISNDSGCGGAALSRRAFGETVKRINTSFPHWFCGNFKKYNGHEDKLPVDQHMLVALIAPRPVYIASAQQDRWADPHGEFLSALHADPVYRLLGTKGLPAKTMPAVNHPVMGRIGYHIRTGGHDVKDYDWEQYLRFADMHLTKK
jgi:(4-O-methyl)-D-glucuronate---lignin esterase